MTILLIVTAYIALSDALWRQAASPLLATSERIIRTSAEATQ
jgi:hypothetical protein